MRGQATIKTPPDGKGRPDFEGWTNHGTPRPEMSVDEIMRAWPATIPVFIRNAMLCVGCPIGRFHDVTEACEAHGIDKDRFLAELRVAVVKGTAQARNGEGVPLPGCGPYMSKTANQ